MGEFSGRQSYDPVDLSKIDKKVEEKKVDVVKVVNKLTLDLAQKLVNDNILTKGKALKLNTQLKKFVNDFIKT